MVLWRRWGSVALHIRGLARVGALAASLLHNRKGVQERPPHQSKARAAIALDGMAWARLAARLLLLLLGVQPGEQASRMRVASCRIVDTELGKHVCATGLHALRTESDHH